MASSPEPRLGGNTQENVRAEAPHFPHRSRFHQTTYRTNLKINIKEADSVTTDNNVLMSSRWQQCLHGAGGCSFHGPWEKSALSGLLCYQKFLREAEVSPTGHSTAHDSGPSKWDIPDAGPGSPMGVPAPPLVSVFLHEEPKIIKVLSCAPFLMLKQA